MGNYSLATQLVNSVLGEDLIIDLPSRDGIRNYLVKEPGDKYQLVSEINGGTRILWADDRKTIEAVDPPGGPFLKRGIRIKEGVIQELAYCGDKIIVTLDRDE